MRFRTPTFTFAALCVAGSLAAQQQPAPTYIMGAYYRCDIAREARADSIYRTVALPILEKHRAAGHITRFGFSSHRHGGAWRRIEFMTGSDLATMFRVQAEYIQEFDRNHPTREFDAICGSHDDYVWEEAATGPATTAPAAAPPPGSAEGDLAISTYYECEVAREAAADSLFQSRLAPILDRHAGMGHVSSWSWLRHSMGGTFRRVLVLRAPDMPALLQGRAAVIADARRDPAMQSFTQICGRHVDYIWSVVASR